MLEDRVMRTDSRLLGGLDLLAAIVQTGSFVGAGARLGLTQSGVSRAVARLEQRIGVRLFDRNARAVSLTDEGRRFHERVAPLVGALEEAVDGAAGAVGRVRGRLRITVDASSARYVIAPRLADFMAAYPELEVEVAVRDRIGNLVSEGFDAAVWFGEPEPSGLVARRLLDTRIITCASPAYLARHGRPRHPRDLARGHVCVHFVDPRTGLPFDWEFHQGRKRIRVAVSGRLLVNDVATAVGACVGGLAIAQPMELSVGDLLRDGRLIELFPRWRDERFPVYLYYPSRALAPAKLRAFSDFIVAWSRRPPPD
jgi:DNA-binding transcriptional LysR family regulator